METHPDSYFAKVETARGPAGHQEVLDRCVARLRRTIPLFGLRNPKIGRPGLAYDFCGPGDWVIGFHSGQLWLAWQLTGDPAFFNAARGRRPQFRAILEHREFRDHDLGFQFSLHSVADWKMTGDTAARSMALRAASALLARFRDEGGYIQAWRPRAGDAAQATFANGRAIVDCMENLALLHWASNETGVSEFREVAELHAVTTARHLVRPDGTSFHTFLFDPATGAPIRGENHQGFADDSCWSRGQAWLIHGFAQCYATTGNPEHLATARLVAGKTEELLGGAGVPVWDYALPKSEFPHLDSSAGSITAAGLYILADATAGAEQQRWRNLADRLLAGLIETCDVTGDPTAQGLLAHGAAHVHKGRSDTMLPYGDYYFMEALMRSLGHNAFFW